MGLCHQGLAAAVTGSPRREGAGVTSIHHAAAATWRARLPRASLCLDASVASWRVFRSTRPKIQGQAHPGKHMKSLLRQVYRAGSQEHDSGASCVRKEAANLGSCQKVTSDNLRMPAGRRHGHFSSKKNECNGLQHVKYIMQKFPS